MELRVSLEIVEEDTGWEFTSREVTATYMEVSLHYRCTRNSSIQRNCRYPTVQITPSSSIDAGDAILT